MTPEEIAIMLVTGAAYGFVFAVYGILTKKEPDEPIKPKKALRTVVLFMVAGAVVNYWGIPITVENIEAHLGSVAAVGIIFDMAWPRIRRFLEDYGLLGALKGA